MKQTYDVTILAQKSVFLLTKLFFFRFKNHSPIENQKKTGNKLKKTPYQSLTSLCTMFFNTSQTFHPFFLRKDDASTTPD